MTSDPRPRVEVSDQARVVGVACTTCGHPMPTPRPVCAACSGPVAEATFGPLGVVWSSTVVRIPVGERKPPYALAYVDLDDGPRILAHVLGEPVAAPVGSKVRLVAPVDGDVVVEVVA